MERVSQPNLKKCLVGVTLMKEPGFAAPGMDTSHQIRRNFNSRSQKDQLFKSTPDLNVNCQPPGGERRAVSSISFYSSKSSRSEDNAERHRSPRSHKDSSHRRLKVPSSRNLISTDSSQALTTDISKVPPIPTNLLKLLGTREVPLLGKVRVSVRLSPLLQCGEPSILTLDKNNRLVIHEETKSAQSHFNRIGVSAPKIYAFDQVFSKDDDQNCVVSKVVPDILQAVLGGNDGCVLSYGGSGMGKTYTMVLDNGIMPSTISWLYQAVNHLRTYNSVKFSIRVSAAVVDASGKSISDALASCANDSEIFPSALLRQGYLSSLAELRAPSAEAAAKYLNIALNYRTSYNSNKPTGALGASTLLFTLHVYQQSIDAQERGKVVGARSRLHLLDLGDMSGHNKGSLSLSGLTSVLLSIFNGKKYLPHKSNKLTHLLQEALGSVTCHASMIVHVSPTQRHSQHTLATLQLASRVHRLRRKKVKGVFSLASSNSSEGSRRRSSGGSSAGSSSIDFSSSEQSADTVIYLGGGDPGDSTDGEHPPMFFQHHIRRHRSVELPRFNSFEQLKSGSPISFQRRRPTSASPTPTSRSAPLVKLKGNSSRIPQLSRNGFVSSNNSIVNKSGFFRHQPGVSRINYADNVQASSEVDQQKSRPVNLQYNFYREPNVLVPVFHNSQIVHSNNQNSNSVSYKPKKSSQSVDSLHHIHKEALVSDEQWIDGPRVSKHRTKTAPTGQPETWVDGPSSTVKLPNPNYGFMDDHKKTMIENWVQNQSAQLSGSEVKTKMSLNKVPLVEDKIPKNEAAILEETAVTSIGEDINIESDMDTISEDQSTALTEAKRPNFISELERKNLIPPIDDRCDNRQPIEPFDFKIDPSEREEISIDDVCSQCEALSEECKELSSLCEEELNHQIHKGLATVVEEPELESVYGRSDDPIDLESLRNNPQTDQEEEDQELSSECTNIKEDIPDVCRRRSMAVKKTVDCSVQVYQEDIALSLCTTPCPSEYSVSEKTDDHPLRVLSEENLSCSSTFTDCLSQSGDMSSDCGVDNETNLLEGSEYFYDTNYLHNLNCQELTTLHNHLSALKGNNNPLKQQINIVPPHSQLRSPCTNSVDSKNNIILRDSSKDVTFSNINIEQPIEDKSSHHNDEAFIYFDKCTNTDLNSKIGLNNELLLNAASLHCLNKHSTRETKVIVPPVVTNSTLNLNSMATNGEVENHNENDLICDPSSVFSCGSLMNRYGSVEKTASTPCNDSDCHSNASDDSDYIGRSSKFSKFLCVGLGRSKSKSSVKNTKLKSTEERKSFMKINKNKSNSKNLTTSPSRQPALAKSSQGKNEASQCMKSKSDRLAQGKNGKSTDYLEINEPCYQNVLVNRHDYNRASNTTVVLSSGPSQTEMSSSCPTKSSHTITTSGSLGTTQSLGESSGYESILRDSECSSFSSSQESEADEEYRREKKFLRRGISFKKCVRTHPSSAAREVEGSRNKILKKLSK